MKGGISSAKVITHSSLRHYLKDSEDRTVRRLGEDLSGLLGSRRDADYKMEAAFSVDDAQNAIEEADAYLADLSSVQPEKIGQAMEEYILKTHR